MELFKNLVILCCTLLAAIILGNLFMVETRKARAKNAPWYAPYFTLPGMMVLSAVLGLPLLFWIIGK